MNTLCAPTPNHDLHIGHAWIAFLNWQHAQLAGGDFVVLWDDLMYEQGVAWMSGYSFEHGCKRVRETLQWMGMPPDREGRSSDNAAAHEAACAKLGYKMPRPMGLQPRRAWPIMGCPTIDNSGPHYSGMYQPAITTCWVVDDHLAGIQTYYTGDDFLSEALHYEDIALRLGYIPPHREYVKSVARGVSQDKESKSDGAYTILQLRDAGYEPWQIISTLQECERRSRLSGHARIVVPYGYLAPQEVKWLPYEGDVTKLRGLIDGYSKAAADGDPRFVHSIGDIRRRCEMEIDRDGDRQRSVLT